MTRPTGDEVSDRALVLYALVRRATIEYVVAETEGDPSRIRQAETARRETDDWLEREGVLVGGDRRRAAAVRGALWVVAARGRG